MKTRRGIGFFSLGCFLGALCLFCLFCVPARAAEGTRFELIEPGLSVTIPDGITAVTRDTPADDPAYAAFGLTKSQMDILMEEMDLYLDGIDRELDCELMVVSMEVSYASIIRMDQLSPEEFAEESAKGLKDLDLQLGRELLRYELYEHSQVSPMIKLYYSLKDPAPGRSRQILQYYAVCGGQGISFTLSASGEIDGEKEALLKEIVDSVDFWYSPLSEGTLIGQSGPTPYLDEETQLSLVIPEGWEELPAAEGIESMKLTLRTVRREPIFMMYTSQDLWADFSEQEKEWYPRGSCDNSLFNDGGFLMLGSSYGLTSSKVSRVSYGGKEFVRLEGDQLVEESGNTVKVPTWLLIRLENGFMYLFSLSGLRNDAFISDFEKLMESVSFPLLDGSSATPEPDPATPSPKPKTASGASSTPASSKTSGSSSSPEEEDPHGIFPVLANVGVFCLLLTVVIVSIRSRRKKREIWELQRRINTRETEEKRRRELQAWRSETRPVIPGVSPPQASPAPQGEAEPSSRKDISSVQPVPDAESREEPPVIPEDPFFGEEIPDPPVFPLLEDPGSISGGTPGQE